MPAERDHIYVIPPNKTMGIAGGKFTLFEREASHSPHLPIDYFLTALAGDRGDQAIGIILSGTASDGTQGCIAIKLAGGITFAQDDKSAKYHDMPGNAIHGGSIDFVLPPKDIARQLVRISHRIYAARIPAESLDPDVTGPPTDLDALFALLQKAMGVDFRHYKQTTLQRRIKRRMVLHHLLKLKDYLRHIDSNPTELDALFRDLLIHVTEFFRNEGAFDTLRNKILPNNEELQSTNEELETTKEELQSSNEELSTLNEELQNSNAELTLSNNDQLNLMTNVNLPVVMVGNDLRIRRFTPPAEKLLNLLPGDVGRRLGEIRSNIEPDDLEQAARTTIENAVFQEREVRVKDGPWYLLRIRPYKTWEDKIEGAVLSFQDIDNLKRTLDQTRTFAEALIENARESILVPDDGLRVT